MLHFDDFAEGLHLREADARARTRRVQFLFRMGDGGSGPVEGRRVYRAYLKCSDLSDVAELADGSRRSYRIGIVLAPRPLRRGLLIDRRRLVTIVPPGLRDAARVARFCRWSAEHVPIGEPVRGLVPVRNPIAAGADHPVEYPAGRRQARAAIGCDDLVDERIDDRIGNAGEILRALHRGGLRGKITPQRVAGRARKGEPLNREVEVEIIDAFAILYRVDDAQARLDAQRP